MRKQNSQQSGQAVVFLALTIFVLAGMLGLVIDGGLAQDSKMNSQAAADGAALAAAYQIAAFPYNSDFTVANRAANQVMVADGLNAGNLALSYLKADRATAATAPTNVGFVEATVSFTRATNFLRVLGVNNLSGSTHAEVQEPPVKGTCVFCLMNPSGNSLHMSKNNTLTAAGGSLYVDSNSKQAVKFDSNGNAITSPAGIFIVGDYQLSAQNSISPTPTTGVPAIDDPLALAPIPVVAGPVKNYVAKTSVTLNPGIYKGFDIPAGDTVTMNPGTYVIIPDTSHNGVLGLVVHGTLVADGVTLYLACANYPTACSSGEIGAILDDEGGSLRISPPTSGTYQGMSVMADRANAGSNILDQGIFESVTGTWYTLRMAFTAIHFNVTINAGAIIVDSFQLVQGTTLNLTYVPGSSYFPPGGFVPLTRLVLSQ